MGQAIAAVLGVLAALIGSIPPAVLFEGALRKGARTSLAAGIVSIAISFLTLLVALFLGYALAPEAFLVFAMALVVSFLALWGIEAVRAWRAANGRA